MLKDCKVTITTCTEGSTETLSVTGQIENNRSGIAVRYLQDGDSVALGMASDRLSMQRKGDTSLSCEFRPSQTSAMRISIPNGAAEIPVKTNSYTLHETPKAVEAELNYDLIFSTQIQTFQLKFFIEISEEK